MISVDTQIRIAKLVRGDFRNAEWYAKPTAGQRSLWTDEDEQKHPRDDHGRFAHTMSRGEFHQQEKVKPGYDVQATNKTYWAAVKQAAAEGREVHPKADEEHRQIFGEAVPRGSGKEPPRLPPAPPALEPEKSSETPAVAKARESIRKKLVEDFGEKIGGARKDDAKKLGPRAKKADDSNDERPAWARRYDISQIAKSSNKSEEGKWSITDNKDKSAWGIPREKGVFSSKEEAEAALPLIAVSRNHRVNVVRGNMREDNREFAIVRNITDRKRAVVKGSFTSEDEANRYMATHAAEIIEHQFPRYEDYAYLDHVERHGPEHKTLGKDVTPADFQKAFQFRGGEFGNWQSGKDGVTSLNHAYDALHDLSDALGLPAKSVALNGDLAIAFGARGTGGKNSARAHYEPDARVMNLTKMKGAGSLAHEWSHALDWHLGNGEHAISDPSYKTKLRPEVAAAAKSLRDVISTKETTRVREADRETKLVDAAKAALEGHFKDLENDLKGSSYRPAKPFTPEQQKQWNAAKAKILAGDVGESKYILKDPEGLASARNNPGKYSFGPLEELNTLYKKSLGRSFHTSDTNSTGNRIYWAIKRFDDGNKRVASVGEGAADKIRGKSDFHNNAVDMDRTQVGNYYSLPHEMFARAFEAYVADKLHAKGIRSDYLVSRGKTDNRSYAMFNLKPFPEGEERKNINAAFDQFFAALKHQPRSDEKGEHVQLYSRITDAVNQFVRLGRVERYAGLFDESKHPRGQPENAGQFAPKNEPSNAGHGSATVVTGDQSRRDSAHVNSLSSESTVASLAKLAVEKGWSVKQMRMKAAQHGVDPVSLRQVAAALRPQSNLSPKEAELHRQKSIEGQRRTDAVAARQARADQIAAENEQAGVPDQIHQQLLSAGFEHKATSPSGSRYYESSNGDHLRVSDHDANEATQRWMENVGANEVLWNQANWQNDLSSILNPSAEDDEPSPTKPQSISGQQQGLFDRGEFTTGQKSLPFDESMHPRGQPENAGQFASIGTKPEIIDKLRRFDQGDMSKVDHFMAAWQFSTGYGEQRPTQQLIETKRKLIQRLTDIAKRDGWNWGYQDSRDAFGRINSKMSVVYFDSPEGQLSFHVPHTEVPRSVDTQGRVAAKSEDERLRKFIFKMGRRTHSAEEKKAISDAINRRAELKRTIEGPDSPYSGTWDREHGATRQRLRKLFNAESASDVADDYFGNHPLALRRVSSF